METKFKVVMKKDDEVMKDFLSFTYRAQGQMKRGKIYVMAIGLLVIAYFAFKGGSPTAGIIMSVVGGLMLSMGLVLPKVALARLKKTDEMYKNRTELTYVFAGSSMYVYEGDVLTENVGSYRQISCFYGDEKNYYVGINNEDLFLLPKKSFVQGDESEFIEFIQDVSDEKYEFLPFTLKNRWEVFKVNQKMKEAEYDAKAAAKRAEAKEKKKNK